MPETKRGDPLFEIVCALENPPSVESGSSLLWVLWLFHFERCLHVCWKVMKNTIFGISIQRESERERERPETQGSQSLSPSQSSDDLQRPIWWSWPAWAACFTWVAILSCMCLFIWSFVHSLRLNPTSSLYWVQ